MRVIARLVGWIVVLFAAFLAGGAAASALVGAVVDSETAAAAGAWIGGLGVAFTTWRLLRGVQRRRAAARIVRARAAGEQLRTENFARYKELLDGASETLALTDPELYVGQQLALPPPAEGSRLRLSRGSAWKPPTEAQRRAVDDLTEKLERATLLRGLDDGSAEVVGVRDCVGFRYLVDEAGEVTLVATDDSQALVGRWMRRIAGIGIIMFIGSFVVTFVRDRSGAIPWWLAPFLLVGFVLAFLGVAANVDPRNFVGQGERWHEYGSGWDSGD